MSFFRLPFGPRYEHGLGAEVSRGYNRFWLRRLGDEDCPESVLRIARWLEARGLPLPAQRDPSLPVDLSRRGKTFQDDILEGVRERSTKWT